MLLGGLGIMDLWLFGSALQLCWPWLQRVDTDCSWALLPVKEDSTTLTFFQASTVTVLDDGHMLKFWQDSWLNGQSIMMMVPDLVVELAKGWQHNRMVTSALKASAWISDISGPRTVLVLIQYVQVREVVERVVLNTA
jgi:hypothetical protein